MVDQYNLDENALIECVEGLMEFYNINRSDIINIIKDRVEEK